MLLNRFTRNTTKMLKSEATDEPDELFDSVYDYLVEAFGSGRLEISDIVSAFAELGYEVNESNFRARDHARRRYTRELKARPIGDMHIDFAIMECVHTLGVDNVDPRLALRYRELMGQMRTGTTAAFFAISDLMDQIELRSQPPVWDYGRWDKD